MKRFFVCILLILSYSGVLCQKQNCGTAINHPKRADGTPVISSDGNTLYFARGNCEEVFTCETDIYVSYRQKNGQWSKAVPVKELNNEGMNGVVYLYPDGNRMILKDSYTGKSGFAESYKSDSGWITPVHISFQNETDLWNNHSCKLSSDEKKMIISNRGDLYISLWREDEKIWSKPLRLPDLNTPDVEFTPFLAFDDRTLYFSSAGWGGEGQNDIVKSTRIDSTWKHWSTPSPIGPPVNTPEWESFFCFSNAADTAWVYSRTEGNGDLFTIPLLEHQKPKPIILIEGQILDARYLKPHKAFIQIFNITDQNIYSQAFADPNTGKFNAVLEFGKEYSISAQTKDYISTTQKIFLPDSQTFQKLPLKLVLYPLEKGQKIPLNHIYFDQSSFVLKPESAFELDRMVEMLTVNTQVNIQICGHTDNVGDPIENQKLSLNRALAVKNYFEQKGIDTSRFQTIGYGKIKPIADNRTEAGRIQNRRVELIVY